MSSLKVIERKEIEKLLNMSGGYVSDLSNSTFGDLFREIGDVDIHSKNYKKTGTSKAKKLREFWRIESDYIVGKSISKLVQYELSISGNSYLSVDYATLIDECKAIATRLMSKTNQLNLLRETTKVFDEEYLAKQIIRMEDALQTDPELAIGTAKELVETCCKTILSERGNPVTDKLKIPDLTKKTLKVLKLVPEDIPNSASGKDVIKRLLSNMSTIVNNLADLRGMYGTGHGKNVKTKGLSVRHAKLSVGAASTLVTFLFDTHKEMGK